METLKQQARNLGITLSEKELHLFDIYARELQDWNTRMNLTGITDTEEIALKHFADSLSVITALPPTAKKIIDVGTGAGFPGLPVKIAKPEIELTLVESSAKKCTFLNHIAQTLNLKKVTVIEDRSENLGADMKYREKFDACLSRAVAILPILCEYCLPLVRKGGVFIAQKSSDSGELKMADSAIEKLGAKLQNTIEINLPGLSPRELIVIEKIAETPSQFPRPTQRILNRPL